MIRWRLQGTIVAVAFFMACGAMVPRQAVGQIGVASEAQIKAVFLYRFFDYVKWPPAALGKPNDPIVIGAVGNDQVNAVLKQIAAKRKALSRRLVFRNVTTVAEAKGCQILYVSKLANPNFVGELMPALHGAPILLVGEESQFLAQGGVVAFRVVNKNVRLLLSTKSANSRKLKIRAQLARLAIIVD